MGPRKRSGDEVDQAASRLWPMVRALSFLLSFLAGIIVAAATIWAYLDAWGYRPVWIYELRDRGPAVSLEIYKFHLRHGDKLSPAELAHYCGLSFQQKLAPPECGAAP
jgi:hypothetical protein